jgi:outer membrane protein OmpA-like peptidoglycan-associated protein
MSISGMSFAIFREIDSEQIERNMKVNPMPRTQTDEGVIKNQLGLPNISSWRRDNSLKLTNLFSWAAIRNAVTIVAGSALLLGASGCLATRNWVQEQLDPINAKLNNTDAKADQALNGLQNLHLEKRLVLNSQNGPTFAFGSSNLTPNAKHEIDGFIDDLQGSANAGTPSGRVFVIAGHTDSVGSEDYNYELGQRRAEKVAGYLVGKEGVDPTQVRVVSYGASKPIADNSTASGRRTNRSVEILVYQEKVSSAADQENISSAAMPPASKVE